MTNLLCGGIVRPPGKKATVTTARRLDPRRTLPDDFDVLELSRR
jgi:hypothetical protein